MEDVPCDELPDVIAGMVKHGAFKAMRQQLRKIVQGAAPVPAIAPSAQPAALSPAIKVGDVPEGKAKLVRTEGQEIAVFKKAGRLCALQNNCPHEGGQLAMGWIEGDSVVCPLHGYKFNLQTGACADDPRLRAQVFSVVKKGEDFKIDLNQKAERK